MLDGWMLDGWMDVGWLEKVELKPTQPSWGWSWAELVNRLITMRSQANCFEVVLFCGCCHCCCCCCCRCVVVDVVFVDVLNIDVVV